MLHISFLYFTEKDLKAVSSLLEFVLTDCTFFYTKFIEYFDLLAVKKEDERML